MKKLADGARTEFSGRRVQNRRRPRSFRLLSRPPRPPKVPNSNCRSPPPVRRSPPYPPLRYRGSRSYSTAPGSAPGPPGPPEGPELDLPAPPAGPPPAAVSAAAVPRFALVLDRADVEGRADRLDRLLGLRHGAVLSDVQPDVAPHEGGVPVVDQERLVLPYLADLVVPEGQEDRPGLVTDRRLDELPCLAELRRDLSLFAEPNDLHQDVYLLG